MTTRLAVIVGSTRPGRRTTAVADWVAQSARNHPAIVAGEASVDLVDLADYDLPMFDERLPPMMGQYENVHTRRWAEAIGSYDGFIFVTPEYNHSMPAALKNAIDYLFAEWNNKAAGFVSLGTQGGTRAVEHLRLTLAEVKVATVRSQVALPVFTEFEFTNPTDPTDPGVLKPSPYQETALSTLIDEVTAWTEALAPLRTTTQ